MKAASGALARLPSADTPRSGGKALMIAQAHIKPTSNQRCAPESGALLTVQFREVMG